MMQNATHSPYLHLLDVNNNSILNFMIKSLGFWAINVPFKEYHLLCDSSVDDNL